MREEMRKRFEWHTPYLMFSGMLAGTILHSPDGWSPGRAVNGRMHYLGDYEELEIARRALEDAVLDAICGGDNG